MKYLLFFFVTSFFCAASCQDKPASSENKEIKELPSTISVEQAKEILGSGDYIFIDVRTPDEIAQGKINDALENDVNSDEFAARLDELDRSKHYVVYCRSGSRSLRAQKIMQDDGFEHVYNMAGGYNAWQ